MLIFASPAHADNMQKIGTMLQLTSLQAGHGDCHIVRFLGNDEQYHNFIIDCGTGHRQVQHKLRDAINQIKERKESIDLLIITHIDSDHIKGIIKLIQSRHINMVTINEYWFNTGSVVQFNDSTKISFGQGLRLERYLVEVKQEDSTKWQDDPILFHTTPHERYGAKLTVLSPTQTEYDLFAEKWQAYIDRINQERANTHISATTPVPTIETLETLANTSFKEAHPNKDVPNGSSIAFLLELNDKKILFLADTRPSIIISSLQELGYSETNPLSVDLVKVAHHGSKYNTSNELLSLINCPKFLISTNGAISGHPHRTTLARIIIDAQKKNKKIQLIFNHSKAEYQRKGAGFLTDEEEHIYSHICTCVYAERNCEIEL